MAALLYWQMLVGGVSIVFVVDLEEDENYD